MATPTLLGLEGATWVHLLAALVALAVPAHAWRVRGRTYAIFGALILAFSLPGALVSHARIAAALPEALRGGVHLVFAGCIAAAGLHLVHLARARMRGFGFRVGVSLPAMVFLAAGFLAGFWQLFLWPLRALAEATAPGLAAGLFPWLDHVPFVVALFSVGTSLRRRLEWVQLPLGGPGPPAVTRVRTLRGRAPAEAGADGHRPLRVVQISDPHLGPWQPVRRLRATLRALLEQEPDLVLLTGDFLTMEGAGSPGSLARALEPLRAAPGRCFAIFGNHDHEAPEEVKSALAACGVRLLLDDEARIETRLGPVQIVGADWVRRGRREHLHRLLERFPRRPGALRLLLLHDPVGFHHLPEDEVDLTLSGHTHGGQLGLVSFGLDWTVLSRTRWPDHGLFARGRSRLYVHRGTGFYGFPLRVGVPGELSVLELLPEAGA